MFTEGTMEIEMNQAVAGIKGTTLVLEEMGEESRIKVIEGVVSFRAKSNNQSVDVGAGEAVSATPNGINDKTQFDVQAEKNKWSEQVNKNMQSLEKSNTEEKNNSLIFFFAIIIIIALVIGIIFYITKQKK